MSQPAAEVRRTGWWRWTVTLTGVRSHHRPRTVRGPAILARRAAARMLARAAGPARPADFTVRLPAAQLGGNRVAAILARHAATRFSGTAYPTGPAANQRPPVNLYPPGGTEQVRLTGAAGETIWEGPFDVLPADLGAHPIGAPADPWRAVFTPRWEPRRRDPGGGFLP